MYKGNKMEGTGQEKGKEGKIRGEKKTLEPNMLGCDFQQNKIVKDGILLTFRGNRNRRHKMQSVGHAFI